MNHLDSNWKYNASKKIAQLTKVIFRLHSENLDRKDLVAHVKKKCDDEISAVIAHSNEVINEVQKNANNYRDGIEKLIQNEYNSKFEEVKEEYAQSTLELQEKVQNISNMYESQIDELKKKVDNLLVQNDKNKEEFNKAASNFTNNNDDLVQKLEEKHRKEIEECVQKSNEKINELILKSEKEKEELKLQAQRDMVEQKRSSNSEAMHAKEEYKKKLYELENANRSLQGQIKKNGITIQNLKAKLEKNSAQNQEVLKRGVSELNELKREHESEIERLNKSFSDQLTEKSKEIKSLQDKINLKERERVLELRVKDEEWSQKVQDLEDQIDDLHLQISNNTGVSTHKHLEEINQYKQQIEELLRKHSEEIETVNMKNKDLENEIEALTKRYTEEIDDLKKLNLSNLSKFRIDTNRMKLQYQEELEKLKESYIKQFKEQEENMASAATTNSELLKASNAEVAHLKEILAEERSSREYQIMDFQSRKAQEIQQLNSKHTAEIEAITASYENKYKNLEEQWQKKIDDLKAEYEENIKVIEEKNELNLRLSIEKQNAEIEQKMTSKLEIMRDQMDNEIQGYKDELDRKDLEIKALISSNENNMIEKNHLILSLKDQLEAEKKQNEDAKRELIESYNQEITKLQKEIDDLKAKNEIAVEEIEKKYKLKLEVKERRLVELDSQRISQLSQLKMQFEDERNALQDKIKMLNAEMKEMMLKHEKIVFEYQERIEKMKTNYESQIKEMKNNYEKEIEEEKKRSQSAIAPLETKVKDLTEQLRASQVMYQNLMAEMENYASKIKRDELLRISELEKQKMKDIKELSESYQSEIDKLNENIEKFNDSIKLTAKENEEKIAGIEKKWQNQLAKAKQKREKAINDLKLKQEKEINNYQQKIAELDLSIEAWEQKFNTREGRPEDIQKIQELEEAVKEKSDILMKLFNELKHYQNELVNREYSYNKLFNTKPSVGELNVIERKMKIENLLTEAKTGMRSQKNLPKLTTETDELTIFEAKRLKTISTPRKKPQSSLNSTRTADKSNQPIQRPTTASSFSAKTAKTHSKPQNTNQNWSSPTNPNPNLSVPF